MVAKQQAGQDFADIRYETGDGIAKITINRPEVRNAFRPTTVSELLGGVRAARDDPRHRRDHSHRRGGEGLLLRGRPEVRGHAGYVGQDGVPR